MAEEDNEEINHILLVDITVLTCDTIIVDNKRDYKFKRSSEYHLHVCLTCNRTKKVLSSITGTVTLN